MSNYCLLQYEHIGQYCLKLLVIRSLFESDVDSLSHELLDTKETRINVLIVNESLLSCSIGVVSLLMNVPLIIDPSEPSILALSQKI